MQCKDISDKDILEYLYDKQGTWTSLWYGYFKDKKETSDVYYAMPSGTPEKLALAKMKTLCKRKLVAGCACGCRGDFEITDKGLEFIGKPRLKPFFS